MKTSKTPTKELIAAYKKTREGVVRAGRLVLEMLSHPDITPEMIHSTVESYRRIRTEHAKQRNHLRTLWPRNGSLFTAQYPWNEDREDRL